MSPTILFNANIHSLDPANPSPQAIALQNGKILATGNLAALAPLADIPHSAFRIPHSPFRIPHSALPIPHSEFRIPHSALPIPNSAFRIPHLIDLQGKTLLPAFFDAHIHLWKVGDLLTYNLDLRGVQSIEEIQEKLLDFSRQHPHLEWIRARGYNEAQMREGRLPTRHDLDRVIPGKPVFLQRTCAHIAVLNSKALEICGISAQTPVPFGGEIRLEAGGAPSGILSETALGLAMRHFPPTTTEAYENMILAACRELLRHGVTAATDPAVMPDLLEVYLKMDREGRLPMRIHAVPIVLPDGGTEPLPIPALYHSENLVINTVKFFSDGGLSGQTAALTRPYLGGNSRGILRLEREQFFRLALGAQEKGFQVATHSIGDEAIALVLDVYERLYRQQPDAPRHRIEHLGLPTTVQLDRIAGMGLHVVTQPIFLPELGRNFRRFLDEDYLRGCYPVRSLLDRGIPTAFSTDAPVVKDLRPLACIAAAMLRLDQDGVAIAPHEAVSLEEALACYTMGSAAANRVERETGSISAGKDADLVLLERSPFEMKAEDLAGSRVEKVWRRGEDFSERSVFF